MRLLVVQPSADRQGHFGIWTVRLCQALARIGHEITLCTNSVDPSRYLVDRPLFRVVEAGGGDLRFERYDAYYSKRRLLFYYGYFRNSRAVLAEALAIACSGSFDGVFLTDTEFLVLAEQLSTCRSTLPPVVVQLHAANFSFSSYDGSLIEKGYKVAQREVFRRQLGRRIRALSVLGEWARDAIRTQLRLPASFPIEIVPDAGGTGDRMPDRAEARAAIGLRYDGPVFMLFGIWRQDKGLLLLLAAAERLRHRDFRVLIVGSPRDFEPEELRQHAEAAGLGSHVILRPGYVSEQEVPDYMRACDALVLPYAPSYNGGSGPLLKGACAYGRPAIVADVAEMGGLVRRWGVGMVFEPGSASALSGALEKFLASSSDERQVMSLGSRRLGAENAWEAVAGRLARVFETVGRAA